MRPSESMKNTPFLVVGAALFGVIQFLLFRTIAPNPEMQNSAWFLNSGAGVGAIGFTFAVAGALVGVARRKGLAESMMLTIGAALAMATVLFSIGPGPIFPIVIVFGLVILAIATTTGAVLGMLVRRSSGRPTST